MEPIFRDEELKELLSKNWMLGGSADDMTLAKAVRDAVEDKFHILVEEDMQRRQLEYMIHVQEISRLIAEARSED